MRWQGTIDFAKPILLNGKHHGVEPLSTLPVWQASDAGRVVYAEDTGKLWLANSTEWSELTPGTISVHDHDDRYYTEIETDLFFEGYSSGKAQVGWDQVVDKPTGFNPSAHGNEAHTTQYAAAGDISFETLNTNGDVGNGSDQLAIGSHNHDSDYEIISTITKTLYVDGSRIDVYTENGSFTRPYKTITSALGVATTGMTVIVSSGIYPEDIVVPAGVSLVSHSQVKVSIQGDATFNGPGVPITIQGIIFTGSEKTLTVNCTAHLFETYSYSRVIFGPTAHISANVFNINVNQTDVDALTFNGTGDLTLMAASIKAKGDSHAIVMNSGRLAFFNGEVSSENALKATVKINGGTALITSSQVVNSTGGMSIDLTNSDAIASNPNALSGVIAVGNVEAGTASTIINGLEFITTGSLLGSSLILVSSTRIGYDNTTSGLTASNVQAVIDEVYSAAITPVFPLTSGTPTDVPAIGTTRFDSSNNTLYIYNGTAWVSTVLS